MTGTETSTPGSASKSASGYIRRHQFLRYATHAAPARAMIAAAMTLLQTGSFHSFFIITSRRQSGVPLVFELEELHPNRCLKVEKNLGGLVVVLRILQHHCGGSIRGVSAVGGFVFDHSFQQSLYVGVDAPSIRQQIRLSRSSVDDRKPTC